MLSIEAGISHLFLQEVPSIIDDTQGSCSTTASTTTTANSHILTTQLISNKNIISPRSFKKRPQRWQYLETTDFQTSCHDYLDFLVLVVVHFPNHTHPVQSRFKRMLMHSKDKCCGSTTTINATVAFTCIICI